MEHAVELVQAYLYVNGYFTVAEYPVLEALKDGRFQEATDIDLLALRLPHAGGPAAVGDDETSTGLRSFEPDPLLQTRDERPDFLICEVKQGRAELNRGARDPRVLTAVLRRWGYCPTEYLPEVLDELAESGVAEVPSGPVLRLLAFGSVIDPRRVRGFLPISLDHVAGYLRDYVRANWEFLRYAQIRQPAFGFFALLEQADRAAADGRAGQAR